MSFWSTAPKPKSRLGYHRVLAPSAGVKVSPLCLGAMNFGTAWNDFMGECSKETAFKIMDAFYENGGNFIDTANNYQNEQSEQWIGEWMKARGNRDQIVLATKYTTGFRAAHFATEPIQSNFVGNSAKSMHVSVKRSLEKLQTDYIDLLYVHWWDFTTGVEEVMHALNALVVSGKVLYLGVSDTPAWVVVKANDYARANGLRPFAVYQGKWNAAIRDMERDVVPMCRDQGMGIAPWAPLGGGKFKSAEARQGAHEGSQRAAQLTEQEIKVSEALEGVAKRKNTNLHAIALAYIMNKSPYIYPIVGQRKVEHLLANIEALGIELSKEDMDEIDTAVPFDPGFPHNFIFPGKYDLTLTASDVRMTSLSTHIDAPPHQAPVKPRKLE
ncbi:aldo/keto reductase [Aspergillus lucknowensis]|uniref:NADP-dependent oxidoreductase domain-containing protein n=1 Tax=Aspergillus lucknowensis TaxID=176173 RepID=A0ABR4LCQ9_9EURO